MTKTQPRPAISNPLLYFRSTVVVVVVVVAAVVVLIGRNLNRQVRTVVSSSATESRRWVAKGRSGVWRDALLPLRADMFAVRKQRIPLCAQRESPPLLLVLLLSR